MSAHTESPTTLTLPESTRLPSRQIADCEWRIRTFLERDAYAAYDAVCLDGASTGDRLTVRHRVAMNGAMRARSTTAGWAQFLDQPLVELGNVPSDLCLVRGGESEVELALRPLGDLVAKISSVHGISDMGASKMLFLLRPRIVAISDSYVRAALGLRESPLPSPSSPRRTSFARERFLDVSRAMRAVGRANDVALSRLGGYVAGLGSVTVAAETQESVARVRGQSIRVELSAVRILDILLWTEVAIRGPRPDRLWSAWAAAETI